MGKKESVADNVFREFGEFFAKTNKLIDISAENLGEEFQAAFDNSVHKVRSEIEKLQDMNSEEFKNNVIGLLRMSIPILLLFSLMPPHEMLQICRKYHIALQLSKIKPH